MEDVEVIVFKSTVCPNFFIYSIHIDYLTSTLHNSSYIYLLHVSCSLNFLTEVEM